MFIRSVLSLSFILSACAAMLGQEGHAVGNAEFVVPPQWTLRNQGQLVLLNPPEADSHAVLVRVTALDANAAAAAAWARYKPAMKRAVRQNDALPAREGWDARQQIVYETTPNERAVVIAVALRAGGIWTVVLLDGTEATFEKRGAQFSQLLSSLRPKGYTKESFAERKALRLDAQRISQMKSFVETSMKKLQIPGVAFALIDQNRVVFEGGFGVKEAGKPERVDQHTLFMAASNTKGMATLLLSLLADEGKLRWEQPVIEVYPKFRLGDPETTRQVLMKHLVCACTGLPRQDLEWLFEFQSATATSSMELLGTMKPTSKFGEVFQYSNLRAAAAGYIGAALYAPNKELGASFDEAMARKIFQPLGMNATTFDMAKALNGNYARPHADNVDGKVAKALMNLNYSVVPHRPAGGVWTSAHDLIRYVQLELNKGNLPDGRRLVSENNILVRRMPQIPTGEDSSYGMGLSTDSSKGVTVVNHGGSLIGYKSDIMFLPDHGIGAVLLTNSDNGYGLMGPFQRRLLELVFDGKPEAEENVESAALRLRVNMEKERKRLSIPAGKAAVMKLARAYRSPQLGSLTVRAEGGRTIFDVGEWRTEVGSRNNDDGSLSFMTITPGIIGLEFVAAERNGKRVLILRDAQHEYLFTEGA